MIPRYPIHDVLAETHSALMANPVVLLQAPTGAGKSTVLPLDLLDAPWLAGQKILVLQPRRLAARAVATRMAELLGEIPGQTVGYRVRFESKIGKNTRIEVLTEGILTRMIQDDPSLEGVGMVIFDEFHERSLNADLAWVFTRQAQEILRDDLKILVMSATLNTEGLSAALGNPPVIMSEGRQFPVEMRYFPPERDVYPWKQVIRAVRKALREDEGDILAFLPGVGEIHRVEAALQEAEIEAEVFPLYGNLPLKAQKDAILPAPSGKRKVVLATSIAETSLTIEGIKIVIDSGQARVPRYDPKSGLTRLETIQITRDAADQRAGRAGRLGPGICYRLWEESAHRHLIAHRQPEILQADLAPLLLEIALWGGDDLADFNWPTVPPKGAIIQARELLNELNALTEDGKITARGKRIHAFPTHPRLANMLVEANEIGEGALAADIAALLEERDPLPRGTGADLRLRLDALRNWRNAGRSAANTNALKQIDRLAQHWRRLIRVKDAPGAYDYGVPGHLLAFAYPGRIARQIGKHQPAYRLSNGRRAQIETHDSLIVEEWLAIAQMDAGKESGKIFLAAPVAPTGLANLMQECTIVEWDAKQGVLVAQVEQRVGNLAYATQTIRDIPQEKAIEILCEAIMQEPSLLPWNEEVERWQNRVLSLRAWRPDEAWPDVSQAALMQSIKEWLGPYIGHMRRADELRRLDLLGLLVGMLPWELASQLDRLAPTHLEVPTGSNIRLQYAADGSPPILAVRLQEMFSCLDTPTVNAGRTLVMVHLLSPAMRPMQITQDLRGFWERTYHDVRKDMRGRYSKHYWPEDPFSAEPTRGVRRR